ncbi:sugar lactone lactonase YvrE [Pseudorhizobium tarimense]|uniref:Sugar lactone lactonase YvrE n=1 Tax=Pseudorhizobium tarimense TaxID=1079109 RepID=A0ABV2HCL7_9HYPH|nr:major royal jelly family protein [Pseudorhizobium tarimense]MCJ8520911.1 major royal jelly family protein [Pseudorhizobium tarimense]
MSVSRRFFLQMTVAGAAFGKWTPSALADEVPHEIAATSPWFCNQVAFTSEGHMFFGLPRYPDHDITPSLAKRAANGEAVPFPGNGWNDWKPGDDGKESFVYVNSIHIFKDNTLWVVDQGGLRADSYPKELSEPKPGAQKLVQMDPETGKVLKVIAWDKDILPEQAKMNDLRVFDSHVYVTDSGLGALIYHNLETGKTLRRLSGYPQMQANVAPGGESGNHKTPKIDMIEVSKDGEWLYAAAPTGPFVKIRTADIRNESLTDDQLAEKVEHYAGIPRSGGCCLDTLGNLYLSELDNKRVSILAPDGTSAVLTSDEEFISPDGTFMTLDRTLYLPVTQARRTRLFGNETDMIKQPWKIYAIKLPQEYAGIKLGDSLNG